MSAKPCKACAHQEHDVVDRALAVGRAPRSAVRRYAGPNRKALFAPGTDASVRRTLQRRGTPRGVAQDGRGNG